MAGQRLIDPTDPESVMRMMRRIDALEQKMGKVTQTANNTKKRVAGIQSGTQYGSTNFRPTMTLATAITWPDSWLIDSKGTKYQIPAGGVTTLTNLTATQAWVIYNTAHKQLTAIDSNSSVLGTLTSNSANIVVCRFLNSSFAYPHTTPFTSGVIYPLGTDISGL